MDLVLSLDCQKSDAQSVGLNEDRGAKELFAPDIPRISDLSICVNSVVVNKKGGGKVFCPPEMVPLHHDTSLLLKLGWPIGSKAEETKAGPDGTYIPSFQLPRPDIGECEYCLKVGEHIPQRCPYKDHVPKNAILGSGCDVVNTGLHHARPFHPPAGKIFLLNHVFLSSLYETEIIENGELLFL
ncbi:uncharacterized protein LOC110757549 isoform X2 [Prunus avium]|uniref:Uncharacterized protein LOC110757549 isoform X2 n=1 Tax=Prunus avium TaxID=42229 RepID=A0A6P5SM98_PRUAV|nr:uncharacterized protein LOC110757549 isoform X2 [Prunus avium]